MKLELAMALCVLTAACATTPEQPAALDPVGMYDFSTSLDGTPVTGTITITKTTSGYGGSIATSVTETIAVRSVTVEGQKLTVLADAPDGAVTFVIELNGDEFAGIWTYAGMSGTHTGTRRRG